MQKEYRARVSMRNPVHFLALGFGSGLVPFMPGTFGSLAAVPLIYFSANLPVALFITFTLVASVVGIYLCGKTAGKEVGGPFNECSRNFHHGTRMNERNTRHCRQGRQKTEN